MSSDTRPTYTVRNLARSIAGRLRAQEEAVGALRQNPGIPPTGLTPLTNLERVKGYEARKPDFAAAHTTLDNFERGIPKYLVYPYVTTTAAIAGAAAQSQSVHWAPQVWAQELGRYIAVNDRATVAALLPLLESLISYKQPFANDRNVVDLLVDAKQYLEQQPEAIAAREDRDWVAQARGDLKALEGICNRPDALEALDVHLNLNTLPTILP